MSDNLPIAGSNQTFIINDGRSIGCAACERMITDHAEGCPAKPMWDAYLAQLDLEKGMNSNCGVLACGAAFTAEAVREEPTEPSGMFRDHSCWKCQDGKKSCVRGAPHRCEYPHARND